VEQAGAPTDPVPRLAEQAVLGAFMLDPRQATQLLGRLREDDFVFAGHAEIFTAIRNLHHAGSPIDPLLVHAELRRRGQLRLADTSAGILLVDCVQATYHPGTASWYAKIVLENTTRRRITEAGLRLQHAAESGRGTMSDLLNLVHRETDAIQSVADRTVARTVAPAVDNTVTTMSGPARVIGSLSGPRPGSSASGAAFPRM
jgi:replicative DNA helicase